MKRNIHLILSAFIAGTSFFSIVSCQDGSEKQAMQSQIDSLTTELDKQAQDLGFYQECIAMFTEGMDSIAKVDSNLMTLTTNQEGTVTRESIKQDLDTYAGMLARQRERIGRLESQLNDANEERSQLRALLDRLNEQIAEKDAIIQELQDKLEQSNFNIKMLQDQVNRLYSQITDLQVENKNQRKAINIAQDMINEAYYIVGTSKELKEAGVLAGKFLSKSKVDVNNLDVSVFTKVDLRKFTRLNVEGKITLKSEHKSDSYKIEYDKQTKTSTLYILDEGDFWKTTRFLIIQK